MAIGSLNAKEEDHHPRQMIHREVSVEPDVGHSHPEDDLDTTKRTDVVDVGTDDIAQDEITMYGITIDEDPEEIIIGDITTGHSETFTNVTLPAPAGDKAHEASIRVKVDTGVGGNILPLQLFHQMYPDQVGPDGLPK